MSTCSEESKEQLQIKLNLTCSVYTHGTESISPPANLYKINRIETDSSCGNAVRCAAPQPFKKISDSGKIRINITQCPQNLSITTINVFVNSQGMHAYSTSDSVPLQGFSKTADFLRFFFGDECEKTGYNCMPMTAFPQYCWYYNWHGKQAACYTVKQIREYKNQDYYDFVYLENAPTGYIETDVKQMFWIYDTNC
ncbi:hypothetical protein TELCIR_18754 [Teladorsagia circumcincta]|uniref:Uncharacterized protein n=1 Tax=Teladorsagia circumcincta TaxID=45464 RepID=A0A2G9TR47_TELCI|nr:hypothetical protein TELCIR_18754 [Teladorsagia circumcincta]